MRKLQSSRFADQTLLGLQTCCSVDDLEDNSASECIHFSCYLSHTQEVINLKKKNFKRLSFPSNEIWTANNSSAEEKKDSIINICVIGLKAGDCRAEKSYFNSFPPFSGHSSSPLRKLCGKAPGELVEMLSPLQQQQGSGHGSKHPTCPKLAAKWPITWVKAGEKGLGKIWLLLNSAKL